MGKSYRIYVVGHGELIGSAVLLKLVLGGFAGAIGTAHHELELTDPLVLDHFLTASSRNTLCSQPVGLVARREANLSG
jgi:hypothetical protein